MANETLTAEMDAFLVAEDDAAAQAALTALGGAILGANTFVAAQVIDGTADAIQLRVQAHSTQTADVFVIEDSAGTTDYFKISGTGEAQFRGYTLIKDAYNRIRFEVQSSTLEWAGGAVITAPGNGLLKVSNWGSNNIHLDVATDSVLKLRNTDNTDYGTLYFKLPTSNPGPGVIWNNAGAFAVGT